MGEIVVGVVVELTEAGFSRSAQCIPAFVTMWPPLFCTTISSLSGTERAALYHPLRNSFEFFANASLQLIDAIYRSSVDTILKIPP